jgi:hypothetical protein
LRAMRACNAGILLKGQSKTTVNPSQMTSAMA